MFWLLIEFPKCRIDEQSSYSAMLNMAESVSSNSRNSVTELHTHTVD